MPDFIELARKRFSVRAYRSDPVPRELLDRCLEAARLAPSACNSQPWRFVVVDEPTLKEQVAAAARGPLGSFNTFVPQAPVVVAVAAEKGALTAQLGGAIKEKDYARVDLGIATGHFCLQAAEVGLGTCILGWFDEPRVKELLGVPRGLRVELLIAVGYPADGTAAPPKQRHPLEKIRSYNRF